MRRLVSLRSLGVLLAVLAMAFGAACGREGSPGAQPVAGVPVAQNVQVPGSPTFAAMQQRGRVILGVKNDQPGLGLQDPTSGQYTGFDVEIGRMVAAGLGFAPEQIEYRVVPSAAREDAISRGDVDMYVGTYTINDSRKQRVGFAGPYFVAGQDLLVRADDQSITGPQTLQGKRVCSATGSTPIQRVREQNLTQNVVEFQNYSQCVDALRSGQVDAVTTDNAILAGYAAQTPGELRVVGQVFSEEPYGVGLPRDDVALRNKVNDILQTAIDDGTWQRLYDQTLGQSGTPAPTPPTIERY
ncbi:glutamate ABC transporter substrate-binding protein [Actinomycetospora cinnamomea]|uniref:Amino acid ABC transporter substrate-binding protein (PAAT family) n=1 Tax=Actinomycetospora cinnamomea TaxID=663609 RepID=A0A2U1FQ80_9PSEU|nr:glutamate ABC transporter substrate-binding protein [Actinomycetospora cinnamomea]PVZ14341.1 amino acid ABC transporter substrate-binding protein (PAAT family) [Actinomycetospora cinnamomea]